MSVLPSTQGHAAFRNNLLQKLQQTILKLVRCPTLGYLDPPHSPRDRRPRLDIAFGVNAERWLIATVRDLLTHKELMHQEPVVRLL